MAHLVGRVQTLVAYNASVLHGEKAFPPERWLEFRGWCLRVEGSGFDASNVAFWWGDRGSTPIIGPVVHATSATSTRIGAPRDSAASTSKRTLVRARKADYDVLVRLAEQPEGPTDAELEAAVASFQPPIPVEQARRFIKRARAQQVSDGKRRMGADT